MRAIPVTALLLGLSCAMALAAGSDRDRDRDGGGPRGRPRVTFYEHADFRGSSFTLEPGQEAENLTRVRFANGAGANDRISSIRVEGGLTVLVFRDARFRGGVMRLTHDVRNLAEHERDWNDAISSVKVERPGRGVPPRPNSRDR